MKKLLFLILSLFFVTTSVSAQAWTAPTTTPPGGNIATPINTGNVDQVKSAGLAVNAFIAYLNSYFAGSVGIGVPSPQQKLDIQGAAAANAYIRIGGGSGSTKGGIFLGNVAGNYGELNFDNATNNVNLIQQYASGNLVLGTNSTEKARITSTGLFGIGTTSPLTTLAVAGQITTTGGIRFNDGTTQTTAPGSSQWTTSGSSITYTTGSVGIMTSDSTELANHRLVIAKDVTYPADVTNSQLSVNGATNPTKQLAIGYDTNSNGFGFIAAGNRGVAWTNLALQPTGGNVGIGLTNPGYKLEVTGNTRVSTDLYLANTTLVPASGFSNQVGAGFTGSTGAFQVAANNTSPLTIGRFGGTGSLLNFRYAGTSMGDLSTDGTNLGIVPAGNLGIGNTGPSYKLDVTGSLRSTDNSFLGPIASQYPFNSQITWQSDNTGYYFGLGSQKNDGTLKKLQMWWIDAATETNINTTLNIGTPGHTFDGSAPNSGRTIGASISSSGTTFFNGGNVGIGIASPATKLQVKLASNETVGIYDTSGTATISGLQDAGAAAPFLVNGSTLGFQITGSTRMNITSAGDVGIGAPTPGYKLEVNGSVGAASFFYTSDRSFKKNIQPLTDSLSKITKLQGVSFDWKKDGTPSVGLIAQDVEKVYPELVNTSKTSGLKSVEYGNLVGPLIEAVKEQQKEIDALKEEVRLLKANK